MVNRYRLEARRLQMGNVKLFSLFLVTFAVLIFTLNLLPTVYENTVSVIVEENIPDYRRIIDFLTAVLLYFSVMLVYYSASSSVGRFFFARAGGIKSEKGDMFYYFAPKRMFRNFLFRLKLSAFKCSILFICILPFVMSIIVLISFVTRGVSLKICAVNALASVVFIISSIVCYKNFTALMFLCPYCFYKNEGITFKEAMHVSQRIMREKKTVLTKIKLSFSGWFLLCMLVFPVGYVWSYYKQSLAVAANSFMNS